MNYQGQRLFETEIIKEKVVFKMSSEACHIFKNINSEMSGARS